MTESNAVFRVKVLVDGRWMSTGDFHVLEQAKERARLLSVHLGRRVKILDREGRQVDGEPPSERLTDESSRNTVILD